MCMLIHFSEFHDVAFFENIFPMKTMYGMSSLPINVIADTTIHEEIDSESPRRSKRPRTAMSFGDDFIVYLVDDTPKTIAEAFASLDADDWKGAVHSEMNSTLSN
jgi:hypothetical protein